MRLSIVNAACMLLGVSCIHTVDVKVPKGNDQFGKPGELYQIRERTAPLLQHPLRQPSICRGPDQCYYLTGTDGTPRHGTTGQQENFQDNDGIRIWRSSDLENWQPLGKVFDLADSKGPGDTWWLKPAIDPESRQSVEPHLGARAPDIQYFNNTFWIAFSINGDGVGLLKSRSGKAEGPYDMVTRDKPLVTMGMSPSLFHDDDGTSYLLWGHGWIAPLSEDMTRLASKPTFLRSTPGPATPVYPMGVGQRGISIFKRDGSYWLSAEEISYRDHITASDVMVASSKAILGPYGYRRWMIPNAGETTIFEGPDQKIYATYCGNDENSVYTNRAGVVPLGFYKEQPTENEIKYTEPTLRLAKGVHTERGCWHEISAPIANKLIRDCQATQAPDGNFYFTGSCMDSSYSSGKLAILISKDLVNWEEHFPLTFNQVPWLTPEAKKSHEANNKQNIFNRFMDCEIRWIKGTLYVTYGIYRTKDKLPDAPNGMSSGGAVGYMRSTTGTLDGPWEQLGILNAAQASFIEDTDGQVYVCSGQLYLGKMNADMAKGREGEFRVIRPQDGSIGFMDVGACMHKVMNHYVFLTCGLKNGYKAWGALTNIAFPQYDDVITSYSYAYMTAKTIDGPYSRARLAVNYGGHASIFQDNKGRWWATFQKNSINSHFDRFWFKDAPGIVPLDVFEKDGELTIRVAEKLPEDFAAAMQKRVEELKNQTAGKK